MEIKKPALKNFAKDRVKMYIDIFSKRFDRVKTPKKKKRGEKNDSKQ